jgi:hypothetical protein
MHVAGTLRQIQRVSIADRPRLKHLDCDCRATSFTSTPRLINLQPRAISMSAADPSSPVDEVASSAGRRKSGRVSKKPDRLFAPVASPNGSTKRKRGNDNDSGVDADEAPSEEESEQSSEGEPDEEELRERRRNKKTKAPARKPAPKKARTNGESVSLAIRPANAAKRVAKRPRKAPVRKSTLPDDVGGLYGRRRKHGGMLHELTHHSRRVCHQRPTTGCHSTMGRALQRT